MLRYCSANDCVMLTAEVAVACFRQVHRTHMLITVFSVMFSSTVLLTVVLPALVHVHYKCCIFYIFVCLCCMWCKKTAVLCMFTLCCAGDLSLSVLKLHWTGWADKDSDIRTSWWTLIWNGILMWCANCCWHFIVVVSQLFMFTSTMFNWTLCSSSCCTRYTALDLLFYFDYLLTVPCNALCV